MTYNNALNIIKNKQSLGIMPGLTRICALLEKMDNPQNKIKIIHIAGTNGKGSVAYNIASNLSSLGLKVGLFTTPWIFSYNEQIQINGEYISDARLAEYIELYGESDCSEFELICAVMYKYFYDNRVDYAVVECGMGGLEDATNVENKNISVLTSISLDHTDFLGKTINEIAMHKCGIIKNNSTCVMYPDCIVEEIAKNECSKKNTKLVIADKSEDFNATNISIVQKVINELGYITDVDYNLPPARKTYIGNILFDGGHNLNAAQSLAPLINDEVALIGMMADKDVEGYLKAIAPKCKAIITTTVSNPRAMSSNSLKQIALKYCNDVVSIDNAKQAFKFASEKNLSLVCGSFYLIREIINDLK